MSNLRLLQASATEMPTVRYKNDKRLRDRLFMAESYQHPAKGHLGLWEDIITRYTQPGQMVLDPMAGVGSTLLAALMGRNVVCVELETHFVAMLQANWQKARQHPMLGFSLGNVTIIQGDARNLSGLLADAIITSPPWEDQGESHSNDATTAGIGGKDGKHRGGSMLGKSYTRPVDAIVSSPPYEQSLERWGGIDASEVARRLPQAYSDDNHQNIGNMRGDRYWEAMRQVYAQCFTVLKPGGIMALVVKGFTRDGKYVDLPAQTASLCETLGFTLFDHWKRELWSLSFWRVLQKRRDPQAFDDRLKYEEVLAFRKPEGEGHGVDAVVTSPPYEAALTGVGNNKLEGSDPRPGDVRKYPRKPSGYGYTRPSERKP